MSSSDIFDENWEMWENSPENKELLEKIVNEIASTSGADNVKIKTILKELVIAKIKDNMGVEKGVLAGVTGNLPYYSLILNTANSIYSLLITKRPLWLTVDEIHNQSIDCEFPPSDRNELLIYLEDLTKLGLIRKSNNCYRCPLDSEK
jgi:hypothetical protein